MFSNPSDVTLAGWVNTTDTSEQYVISLGDNVGLTVNNLAVGGYYYEGSSWHSMTPAGSLQSGWNHIAVTFDDTADTMTLYLNGVAVGTETVSSSISYTQGSNTIIGAHGTDQTSFEFNGLIDDARIYTRALSADEIAALAAEQTSETGSIAITVDAVNDAPVMTAWFNDAWDSRREMTIDSSQVVGDVTNFPMLISLATDAELAAQALANGDDILFTSADGVTQLSHEIEYFDEATGELRVWVKTDLSSSTDTSIYMYFGNSASSSQENPSGVWDNYVGVYHLSESPTGASGELNDSSGSGNHATTEGSMDASDSVTTAIGQGLSFDGSDDMIRITDSASLDTINDEATFSLWINWVDAADGGHQIVMASSNRYSDTDGYEWASQGSGITSSIRMP